MKSSNRKRTLERGAPLNVSESEPNGFVIGECQQPSGIRLHSIERHNRLTDFQVDLPQPTNSSPASMKRICKTSESQFKKLQGCTKYGNESDGKL